jgi:hypothetical protein
MILLLPEGMAMKVSRTLPNAFSALLATSRGATGWSGVDDCSKPVHPVLSCLRLERRYQGHSIRARLLIVEAATGDVDLALLNECQRYGDDGLLAASMGAFLLWIAGRHDELQQRLRTRSREIRGQGRGRAIHARLPAALAELKPVPSAKWNEWN